MVRGDRQARKRFDRRVQRSVGGVDGALQCGPCGVDVPVRRGGQAVGPGAAGVAPRALPTELGRPLGEAVTFGREFNQVIMDGDLEILIRYRW